MRRAALALLLVVAGVAARADLPPGQDLLGRPIAGLSFEGDTPADAARWARLTELTPGRRLTEAAIRTSLRNLFATRLFLDLAVEAAPSAGGALVVIRFAAAPRVRSVALVGAGIPERSRLRDLIGLDAGDTWSGDLADAIENSLKGRLQARGLYEATVTTEVTGAESGDAVDVRVEVRPGRQALVGAPDWSGRLDEALRAELEKTTRRKPGTEWRMGRARSDADRFASSLRKKGFSRAEVRYEGARYDPSSNTVHAKYAVFVGPRIVLRVVGAPESDVRKHSASPWARGEPTDEDAVRRFRLALLETYQERGYARARVDLSVETGPDEDVVTITVDKGARWAVGSVRVLGVSALKLPEVRKAVATTTPGLFDRGRFVERELQADTDAITGLYRATGYRDARVEKPEVTEGKRPFTLDVTLRVVEGPRYVVGRRTLSGASKLGEADLVRGLETIPGRAFDDAKVNADVAAIAGRYQTHGFVDAKVEGTAKPAPLREGEGPAEDVAFSIFEGEPVTFGKTIFRGYRRTRLSVLDRSLAHAEGQPFDQAKLLETQRNLARLGVFSRVDASVFPTDPDTKSRSVAVTVSEGKPWSLLYGVGAELDSEADPKFSARLSFGASYNNLFGRAIVGSGEVRWSRRETRGLIVLREPSFLDSAMPLTLTALVGEDFRQGYEVKRAGVYLDTSRSLAEHLRASLRYQYELVQPSQDPGLGPDQRPNQENRISSIGPGLSWDLRDDPIDPRKGLFLTAEMKYAFPFLAADAEFVRGTLLASYVVPIGDSRLVGAVRFGAIEPFVLCNVEENPTCQPNLEIPIPERLFAGGRTTHRAFSQDQLGVPDQTLNEDGTAYGGNGLLLFNVEWRLRLAGNLGLTLFFDAGNVWDDYRHIRFSQIRPGAGVGLQYLTPVGPIRVEYGVKLDRKPEESPGTFHFSVGYAF